MTTSHFLSYLAFSFLPRFFFTTSLFLGYLLLPFGQAHALPQTGGREGDFLAWGAGARALALGKAYVALATDSTATYWNPAGLAFAERTDVSALHAMLWEGVNYDFVGAAVPTLTFGTFGWFGSLLATQGLDRRDAENTVLPGEFGVAKFATGFAYGLEVWPNASIGATIKWLGRSFDAQTSGFVTMDIGARWAFAPWGVIGGVLQNAGAYRYGNTDDTLPPAGRVGLVLQPAPEWGLIVADVEAVTGWDAVRWRVGVESAPFGPFTARVGMETWEMAGGLGVKVDDLTLDYSGALHPDLGFSHRVAVGFAWGEARPAARVRLAQAAFDRAMAAYTTDPAAAREALDEVLALDPVNLVAQRLRRRLESVTAGR